MTKSKKITLGVVASLATIAAPIALAVSCGSSESEGGPFFVSDGGSITDKSFNQQGAEAVAQILGKSKLSASDFNEPKKSDAATIEEGYSAALNSGKKIIIGTGFHHEASITKWVGSQGDQLKFIIADVDGKNPKFKKNVAGILYETKQSGFLAGYLSAKYLVEIEKDTTPTVGTFGGAPIPSVTDFMIGYIEGVKQFNIDNKANVKFASLGSEQKNYTNSGFASGGGTAKATKLIKSGADIILPVAGPQTADVLSVIKNEAGKFVIGVDTDQKSKYPSQSDKFLTSITKNIKDSLVAVYNKVSGKKSNSWAKGYGETTMGNLSNGLTGIAEPGIAKAKDIYNVIKKDQTLREEASKNTKDVTWDKAYEYLSQNIR
ncbi:BMP family ABC transporter substrate-binding protein [Mycoplasma marinum]|uniref:ABC transporter substrate-binding protein PnrA-like domain-containing protein n=1 Tax=Mycoplasma marinum TaxID=1937190 RepID=A0A4R0XUQ8_9MOLU|nr:BMP family ABC transporter substrate-binding protein [Mycoplasma marinum]TCG11429.1 hypothetical protein C4B24_02040 [Mycoplasma marinum]